MGESTTHPTTELPSQKAFAEDERSVLLGYLDYHRKVLIRKAEGLTDEQARLAPCPPSTMSMLGLIRHMADVERGWFRRSVAAEDAGPIFYGEAHPDGDPDGDFNAPPDATMAEAMATLLAEIEIADANIAARDLDHPEEDPGDRPPSSLRRIIVHLIEEYARHCGHADLIREAIDGATGD
ncbi:MAG: DinB family protein [Actinomycetota bacterium]